MKFFIFIIAAVGVIGCSTGKKGVKQTRLSNTIGNWTIEYMVYNNLHFVNFFTSKKDTVGYFVAGVNEFPLSHDRYFSPGTTLRINKVVYQIGYKNSIDSVSLWRDKTTFKDRPVIDMPSNCKLVLKYIDSICVLNTPHYTSQIGYLNYLYPVYIRN